MAKLTINAAPTFKAKVGIPVAGDKPAQVEFTFKHRTRAELEAHVKRVAEKPDEFDDVAVVMGAVIGWDLDDEFTRENVGTLLQNYHGAGRAIMEAYGVELVQGKLGN